MTIVPSLAGPRRPQDRIELTQMQENWNETLRKPIDKGGFGVQESDKKVKVNYNGGNL